MSTLAFHEWQPTPAKKLQAGQIFIAHHDKINDAIDVLYVRKIADDPNAERIDERLANAKAAVEEGAYCVALESAKPTGDESGKVKVKALHCTKYTNSYHSKNFLQPLPHPTNEWKKHGLDEPLEVVAGSPLSVEQTYVVCFEPFYFEFDANKELSVRWTPALDLLMLTHDHSRSARTETENSSVFSLKV